MLEVIQTSDPARPFALQRRHRGFDGRMVDTIVSRWPTKNAAFDAHYAEVRGLILPPEPLVITKRQVLRERSITASIVAVTVAAISIGCAGLWWGASGTTEADARGVMDAPPYSIALSPR
jgi:hypothetical protein